MDQYITFFITIIVVAYLCLYLLIIYLYVKEVRAHCYCAFFCACHTRHASQTMKVNMMLKAQTFSTRMEHESMWHHGIAVDPGFLVNVTQSRDSANRQLLENFAAILLS